MEKPLVDGPYRLEKFPGKGGWTYAAIPEIVPDKKTYFNWVKVSGRIDAYELRNCTLMPMGNGRLFLAIKAEIRKKIGKEAGDWVHITLFTERPPIEVPRDLLLCLEDEPAAHQTFLRFTAEEQQACFDWIDAAKTDDGKVNRIAATIDRLLRTHGL
ncbi:YdeI/OmpD-associated family protein [Larkinella sp. VNQ87]|uniref:YdeI/OmpD-associated family protein n=1 Tax=Larkinella sp. VNQ87 TaxID=3400921 RepID=UPI003C1068FC